MKGIRSGRARKQRGNALVEFALIVPVMMMSAMAAIDLGMYAFAFLSVENAARAAVLRNSSGQESASDQQTACAMTLEAVRGLPSVSGSFETNCGSNPLKVTSEYCNSGSTCSVTPPALETGSAAVITVTYQMPQIFRLPLGGTGEIRRISQMRVGGAQ